MSPARLERVESAVRLVLAFTEACNRHDIEGMLALLSEDCRFEAGAPAPDGAVYRGKQAIGAYWEEFLRRFPQAHFKVEDLYGMGFRCVRLWRCDWVDEAGEARHMRGMDVFQLKGGLIGEYLSYMKGGDL